VLIFRHLIEVEAHCGVPNGIGFTTNSYIQIESPAATSKMKNTARVAQWLQPSSKLRYGMIPCSIQGVGDIHFAFRSSGEAESTSCLC
jgi:hypothetical protein